MWEDFLCVKRYFLKGKIHHNKVNSSIGDFKFTSKWLRLDQVTYLFYKNLKYLIFFIISISSYHNAFANERNIKFTYFEKNVKEPELIKRAIKNSSTVFNLITHGKPGELFIKNQWRNASEIAVWLIENVDLTKLCQINIFGCEFGKGRKGKKAITFLENTLNLGVAASNNITGSDGDWNLEIGNIELCIDNESYAYNLQTSSVCSAGLDSDGDGINNDCDLDDDNDGILDVNELCAPIPGAANPILGNVCWSLRGFDIYTIGGSTDGLGYKKSGFEKGAYKQGKKLTVLNGVNDFKASHIGDGTAILSTVTFPNGSMKYRSNHPVNSRAEFRDIRADNFISGGIGGDGAYLESELGVKVGDTYSIEIDFIKPVTAFSLDIIDAFDTYKDNLPVLKYQVYADGKLIAYLEGGVVGNDETGMINIYDADGNLKGALRVGQNIETSIGFVTIGSVRKVVVKHDVTSGFIRSISYDPHGFDGFAYSTDFCDTDEDGIPNHLDLDSDNDGCPDAIESSGNPYDFSDLNSNGSLKAIINTNSSSASYGVPNGINYEGGTSYNDSKVSSICDSCSKESPSYVDSDGDGIGDACDLDDDNDGILDTDELCAAIPGAATPSSDRIAWSEGGFDVYTSGGNTDGLGYERSGFEQGAYFQGKSLRVLNGANDYRATHFGDGTAILSTVTFPNGTMKYVYNQSRNGRAEFRDTTVNNYISGTGGDGAYIESELGLKVGDSYSIEINFTKPVTAFSLDIIDAFDTYTDNHPVLKYQVYADGKLIAYLEGDVFGNDVTGKVNIYDAKGRLKGNLKAGHDIENTIGFVTLSSVSKVVVKHDVTSGFIRSVSHDPHGFDNFAYSVDFCDTDHDGVPNHLDLDSDNDGIYDITEAGTNSLDNNNDGRIDNLDSAGFEYDRDRDGLADIIETAQGNDNGTTPRETSFGVPDFLSSDSDADGCSDANEAYNDPLADGDGNLYYNPNNFEEPLMLSAGAVTVSGKVVGASYKTGDVAKVIDKDFSSSICFCPPDYSPTLYTKKTIVVGSRSEIDFVVIVAESNLQDANGINPVELRIANSTSFNFIFQNDLTTLNGVEVDNSNWNYIGIENELHKFQFIGNNGVFPGNTISKIGIKAEFISPINSRGQKPLKVTIKSDSGGQTNRTNDNDQDIIYYNNTVLTN
ncbi:DUF4347 domain-containing protein [Tenacibaculum sp. C7A-26P2]|uniref:DUF4347 domain-containing protein n=1 Tax=Tenacibaculum sp. C7A-26P2 TaxID=3447504 RepID=UPI003F8704E3